MNTFSIEVVDEAAVKSRATHHSVDPAHVVGHYDNTEFAWTYKVTHEESGDTFTGARTRAMVWIKSRGGFRNTTPKPVEVGGLHEQDIWHDPDGVWREYEGEVLGPFNTEREAELSVPSMVTDILKALES